MKVRCNLVLIATVVMTICVVCLIPGSIRFASTWKDLYLDGVPERGVQNFLAPLGFCALALQFIALICLWTGFVKREKWAWFVMLIMTMLYVFPAFVLPLFLKHLKLADWTSLLRCASHGRLSLFAPQGSTVSLESICLGTALGIVTFALMSAALLSTLPAVFLRRR